jgi:MerR family transcriptional regulator, light-induced transcriptional regulator
MDRSFGNRLRNLRKFKNINQQELANELGLSQTSIANYENNVRFPSDIILVNLADYFQISLDYLLGRTDESTPIIIAPRHDNSMADPALSVRYLDAMIRNNIPEAWQILTLSTKTGIPNTSLYDDILAPALSEAGIMWQKGELNIAQEHFISLETERFISLLRQNPSIRQAGPLIASLAPGEENHQLGIRMVNNALEEAGFNVMFLGSQLPYDNLQFILDHHPVRMIALTASMRGHLNQLQFIMERLRENDRFRHIKVIVGGQAFIHSPELWKKIGADGYAINTADTVKTVKRIFDK